MFVAPCDVGQAPSGPACTSERVLLPWNDGNGSGGVFVGATSRSDGLANTKLLATADANSAVAGVQPHRAATTCATSSAAGASGWFLPARNQLLVLYRSQATIGNFEGGLYYWSSTETHDATQPLNADRIRFSDGSESYDGNAKPSPMAVRCIRKGP
jgi:hypothetical protein